MQFTVKSEPGKKFFSPHSIPLPRHLQHNFFACFHAIWTWLAPDKGKHFHQFKNVVIPQFSSML